MLDIVGAPTLVTVKVPAFDAPPPGVGVYTVTEALPAVEMSEASIAAVSRVEEAYVVARFEPFQRTTEPFTKLLPLTVSENAGPPAMAEFGLMLDSVGAGLLTVKVWVPEVPPPGNVL